MNKKYYLKSLKFFLVILASFFSVSFAGAQGAQDTATEIQVSPVRFDYNLNAGEKVSGVINIKNYSPDDYQVEIKMEDFYVSDDSSQANFFVPDQNHPLIAYDMINWVKPEENTFTVAGNQAKNLNFSITVPESTPTGGYYGGIFVQYKKNNSNPQLGGSGVVINTRVGVLLVLGVKGTQPILLSGEIKNFTALKKIFWDKPVQLAADVYNSGNIHYKLTGNMDIYKFGGLAGTIDLDGRVEYPGKIRKYEENWDFSPWAYGYYTAKLNLVSEDGAIHLSKDANFWIIPWKTTVAIIIIIIILWLTFKLFSSKFEIKRKEENEDEPWPDKESKI
jgi:hypothetical protein